MMAIPCLTGQSLLAQIPQSGNHMLPSTSPARSPAPEFSSSAVHQPETIAQASAAVDSPASPENQLPRRSADRAATLPVDPRVFDDPHSLLPRFTRIRVVGNNRTKSQLVGQLGLVKTATGLGGWHRVILDIGGEEIRLQRNALTVVSRPNGDESEFSEDELEDVQQEPHEAVVLPRERRRRAPRPSSAELASNERRVSTRHAAVALPRINLQCLDATALTRYRQHYQLTDVGDSATREQLVTAVGRHFMQQSVNEADTIESFVEAAYMFAQGARPGIKD